jgi:hypothetical protein
MARFPTIGVALALSLVLASCASGGASGNPLPPSEALGRPTMSAVFATADGTHSSLRVWVAATPEARGRGLMFVRSLPADRGMAFLEGAPSTTTFWMKNTLVPLSIAFVDAGGTVITIRDMAPCPAEPCTLYSATAPYETAVEANAGWFAGHGVGVGDHLTLEPLGNA